MTKTKPRNFMRCFA